MKMLVQRIPISTALPFVLAEVKEYTRISFNDDDVTLNKMGWAAAAEVEQFAQVALLTQSVRVTIFNVVLGSGLALPVGPVADSATVTVTMDGQSLTDFELVAGLRPYLVWPSLVRGRAVERVVVEYPAGFGDTAEDVPHDLGQAVLDQVALIFDNRASGSARPLARSSHLARVGARYRGVSV